MKKSFAILALMLLTLNCFAKKGDYIVTTTGDTIYGTIRLTDNYSKKKGTKYIIKTTSEDKAEYDITNAKFIHCVGYDYNIKQIDPEKNKNGNSDFMRKLISNDNASVYVHCKSRILISVGSYAPDTTSILGFTTNNIMMSSYSGSNSSTTTTSTHVIKFYLYDKNGFVEYLTTKNYKDLMNKYFNNCTNLMTALKQKKKVSFDDVFNIYNANCK